MTISDKQPEKQKVIIDTDPGVDDTTCLIFALFDQGLDIQLFTVPPGNIKTSIGARNMCHILDIFKKDYPVAKGPKSAMCRISQDAAWLHGEEGLGGYIPPKRASHKLLKVSAADAMYEVIKKHPHEVSILELGPHTNSGILLTKHPECKSLIKQIIFEGAAPFGLPYDKNYVSFNARTDPEALKIVMESGIPIVMIPSSIGRTVTHLTEEMVTSLPQINEVAKFIAKTYEIYWEPAAPSKRIATNDTCALFYLSKPQIYKTRQCFVHIDTDARPGDMKLEFCEKGNVKLVDDVDRDEFLKIYFDRLNELKDIKLSRSAIARIEKQQEKNN